MHILIPMAGLGSRLPPETFGTIKPLIPINGVPMIQRVVESLALDGEYIFIFRRDMYSNELLATLKELSVSFKFLCVETLTRGPAETCLLAEKLIDNDDELVIANSDQILWWNSSQFLNSVRTDGLDGAIVTFTSSTDRNSYARIDRTGYVTEIREKKVISSIALSGIHYWRQGRDFVSSAKTMIREGKLECGEYFVGPTYNLLIQSGRKIGIYHIPEYQYNPVGIPNDLEKFREKICKDFK